MALHNDEQLFFYISPFVTLFYFYGICLTFQRQNAVNDIGKIIKKNGGNQNSAQFSAKNKTNSAKAGQFHVCGPIPQ